LPIKLAAWEKYKINMKTNKNEYILIYKHINNTKRNEYLKRHYTRYHCLFKNTQLVRKG